MIGDNIKRLMKENGYTQKQLAMRAKCTESAISKYANNERDPNIRILKNLAIALGVTVDELISESRCKSTADVVEVVRCKDCVYRMELHPMYAYEGRSCKVCFIRNKPVSDNGYCSDAIRKENE